MLILMKRIAEIMMEKRGEVSGLRFQEVCISTPRFLIPYPVLCE